MQKMHGTNEDSQSKRMKLDIVLIRGGCLFNFVQASQRVCATGRQVVGDWPACQTNDGGQHRSLCSPAQFDRSAQMCQFDRSPQLSRSSSLSRTIIKAIPVQVKLQKLKFQFLFALNINAFEENFELSCTLLKINIFEL